MRSPRPTSRARRVVALVLATSVLGGACTGDDGDGTAGPAGTAPGSSATTSPDGYPLSGPPGDPAATIDRADVDAAVEAFGPVAESALAETGVPGMSVAVVHGDDVVLATGYGVRALGGAEAVDADTVFPLASLSKPIGATVMASLVGDGTITWDQTVRSVDPAFALADPWVSDETTFADLYAHRSGLPAHAGDLLEDIGYDRDEVLARLRHYPLAPFRSTYAYTNFGMTQAAVAAASTAGVPWEDLSEQRLYEPLGMASTSSRYDDLMARENRVQPHVRADDGAWTVSEQRQPDAQTPAGGVSSSAADLAQWLRLQVGDGAIDGEQLVDPEALLATHTPHVVSGGPRSPSARSGFYGLGWNVGYDDHGRTKLSHSGAFSLGAATAVAVLPGEDLAVVVLTNGMPVGLAEAMVESFLDLADAGEVQRDWLSLYGTLMAGLFPEPEVDHTTPLPDAAPARPDEAYVGTYASALYGPLEISSGPDGLVLEVGPDDLRFDLAHYDGDTFWFQPSGENGVLPSEAEFTVEGGTARSVRVTWLDGEDEERPVGTFTRG